MTDDLHSFEAAYKKALYCLWIGGEELILRVDKHDGAVLGRLQTHTGLQHQGFIITPCNPYSRQLDADANRDRLADFRKQLTADGVHWLPSVNQDADGRWPDEPGALLVDCSDKYARDLAVELEQNALLRVTPDAPPELVWLV